MPLNRLGPGDHNALDEAIDQLLQAQGLLGLGAYGVEPVHMGQGGSIPMAADFQRQFPEATILLTAVCDPDSRMHGPNESLHLADFAKAAIAEALFLSRVGALTL